MTAVMQRSFASVVGNEHAQPTPEYDEDYMLALQLQEQFEVEEALTRTGLPVKVHLGSGNAGAAGRRMLSGDDADDETFDEDEEEEIIAKHKHVMQSAGPTKQHHQVVKTQGRQPRAMSANPTTTKKVVSTKHDPEKAGRKNAERLQSQWYMQGVRDGPLTDQAKIPTPVFNALKEHSRRTTNAAVRRKDLGEDAATHEQVLDKRTRMMLHKLVSAGVLSEMNGCIATGKESSVYHAVLVAESPVVAANADAAVTAAAGSSSPPTGAQTTTPAPSAPATVKPAAAASPAEEERKVDVAVKIMRTTLSEFKNRTSYMPTDLSRQNPRKIIRLWAEKEFSNLKKMKAAGLRCPTPLLVKEHVLIMTMCGKDGRAAPQLREAGLSADELDDAYTQVIIGMRTLYQKAQLVHGDLSEYNMLWHRKRIHFIDVSQAVDTAHPNALYYLRRDCANVTSFFKRKLGPSAEILTTRELFDFITDASLTDDKIDAYLERVLAARTETKTQEEEDAEVAFLNEAQAITRSLGDITDPFLPRAPFRAVVGLRTDGTAPLTQPEIFDAEGDAEDEDEDDDDDDEEEDEEGDA